ncbi:hypothetical protein CCZ01_03615 [Helicobacter monodelphidis]|uniref:hypothetical protein n=1 Tax=Helicobacter sp. 15-1451 TaxID=2004995 RepID=UPI000DCED1ED|nr:hypothetical protein [Helicobacter sp. 15-1451]RAX58173.1 hypothetical protein CCZ01_03615 [Helicobacter sp. 15-1451]
MSKQGLILGILGALIIAGVLAGYYFSQNLNQLIPSSEIEKYLNDGMRFAQQAISRDRIQYEEFSCLNLECRSNQMTIQNENEFIAFKNIYLKINKFNLNHFKGILEFDIATQISSIPEVGKPFIPSKMRYDVNFKIDSKQGLIVQEDKVYLELPVAHVQFATKGYSQSTFYEGKDLLQLMKFAQAIIEDDENVLNEIEQKMGENMHKIGFDYIKFELNGKDQLADTIYHVAQSMHQYPSKEVYYQDIDKGASLFGAVLLGGAVQVKGVDIQSLLSAATTLSEGVVKILKEKSQHLALSVQLKKGKNVPMFNEEIGENYTKNGEEVLQVFLENYDIQVQVE